MSRKFKLSIVAVMLLVGMAFSYSGAFASNEQYYNYGVSNIPLVVSGIGYAPQENLELTNISSASPFLAPSCSSAPSNTNCNGKDPIQAGCSKDGKTVSTTYIVFAYIPLGKVELKWSNKCKTNWAQVTNYARGIYPATLAFVEQKGGGGAEATKVVTGNTTTWSKMWYNKTVRACGMIAPWSSDNRTFCTDYK